MEEYIFIILAIVLSILGAVNRNKNKKNAANPAAPSRPARKPTIFDQFLDETLFEETPVEKQEPLTVPAPPPVAPAQRSEKVSKKPFLNHESTETQIKKKTSQIEKTEIIREKIPAKKNRGGHDIMNGFSLKKAIIYSDIIHRKY